MVKQQRRSEMTEEEKAKRDELVRKMSYHVSTQYQNQRERRGIIEFTDEWGGQRKFFDHQVVAAQRILIKDHKSHYYNRKSALACLHDMGTGTWPPCQPLALAHSQHTPLPSQARPSRRCWPLAASTCWCHGQRTFAS